MDVDTRQDAAARDSEQDAGARLAARRIRLRVPESQGPEGSVHRSGALPPARHRRRPTIPLLFRQFTKEENEKLATTWGPFERLSRDGRWLRARLLGRHAIERPVAGELRPVPEDRQDRPQARDDGRGGPGVRHGRSTTCCTCRRRKARRMDASWRSSAANPAQRELARRRARAPGRRDRRRDLRQGRASPSPISRTRPTSSRCSTSRAGRHVRAGSSGRSPAGHRLGLDRRRGRSHRGVPHVHELQLPDDDLPRGSGDAGGRAGAVAAAAGSRRSVDRSRSSRSGTRRRTARRSACSSCTSEGFAKSGDDADAAVGLRRLQRQRDARCSPRRSFSGSRRAACTRCRTCAAAASTATRGTKPGMLDKKQNVFDDFIARRRMAHRARATRSRKSSRSPAARTAACSPARRSRSGPICSAPRSSRCRCSTCCAISTF